MILRDFQIVVGGHQALQRELNWAAFPVAEAGRLDLKRRRPRAPFAKILVSLSSEHDAVPRTSVSLGICECLIRADVDQLAAELPATSRFVDFATEALGAIGAQVEFRDPSLAEAIGQCREQVPPCQHRLDRLTRTARNGARCETWFVAEYGRTQLEARFVAGESEVMRSRFAEEEGPMFLEDSFPVSRSRMSAGRYQLLDRSGGVLAEALIPSMPA